MSCPTCEHTMFKIGNGLWWCPRCGTLKCNSNGNGVPLLVDRIRNLHNDQRKIYGIHFDKRTWNRLGIFEAILLPEERPNYA